MKMRTKLISLMLAVMMIASVFALCVSAEGVCFHDTEKGIVKTNAGYTIANICKNCGDAVTYIGYVDASQKITLYKESSKSNKYSDAELAKGFASAQGNALYVDNGVISTSGTPYWLTFDLKINAFPKIDEGDAQADLLNADSRAYKGWSVICFCNNSFDAPLRFLADGWEAESGADGSTKGATDNEAPIKFSKGSDAYRFNDTVVNVKAGDIISFALRVDPKTGNYDTYANGSFVGSGNVPARDKDSSPFIRLWEWDSYNRGGLFDFTNISVFKDVYTANIHTHSYTEYVEFYDKGLYCYESCTCGMRNELKGEQIASVVADGLAHIYDGLGNFTINSNSYWFVTDINFRGEIGDGNLLKFGEAVILEAKNGKLVSGSSVLGMVNYPANCQVAVEIRNGAYKLYVNGRYALEGTINDTNNVTCGSEAFGHHVRFMYNKAVTLGATATPAIPTYTADEGVKLCYHTDNEMNAKYKILAHTSEGVEYIYNCSLCGERVYSMLKKDLTNPANDTAYRYKDFAIVRDELASLTTQKPKYLYLENNVIGKTAEPYWLTFDVTPSSLPSSETGDLDDPNTRAYKGYGLVSTEASFMPATELRVIPDGWESGNASGKTKGVTDGRCEVHIIAPLEGFDATTEAKVDSFNYRRSETVAYLEVGKTTHFALRIDPKTGNYDVYVDGVYKASSDKPAMPDMNPKIIFHDNGLGEFTYSNISVCEEAQNFDDNVVAIELIAKFDAKESASENSYTAILAIERNGDKYNPFYANNKSGALAFKDENGKFNTLYDDKGEVICLDSAQKLAVVYDDINGDARYYFGGKLARYMSGEALVFANEIKVYNLDFVNAKGGEDALCFDTTKVTGVSVTGLGKTDTAEVVGFQANDVNNSIRLLSGLDSLYYGAVGYEVQAFKANGETYSDASAIKDGDKVYSSVIADGVTLPATKYGYNYFSALKIEGDLLGYKDSYIIVKPFTVVGSEKYYGEEVKLNILDNGRYEFAKEN